MVPNNMVPIPLSAKFPPIPCHSPKFPLHHKLAVRLLHEPPANLTTYHFNSAKSLNLAEWFFSIMCRRRRETPTEQGSLILYLGLMITEFETNF